jgi:hypothetical protein
MGQKEGNWLPWSRELSPHVTAHPQDLDAQGGSWGPLLNAALAEGHLNIALFLLDHGADGENRHINGQTGP